ncbi:3'-5' exoribonuclease HELZ2-like isoform X1 [Clavelina lepadiformis]|uniref:3'-5' exoribonuclease HELZ2-like isoform X1 n=1 Tax=Clavelina lepadiformis TaxID=159417 RepID=UPI0040413BA8
MEIAKDPNEPDTDTSAYAKHRDQIHEVFSVDELEQLLQEDAQKYKKCRMQRSRWSGKAMVIDDEGDENVIQLPTMKSLGRAFDGDTVVVHISEERNGFQTAQVIGVLKRREDIYKKIFVCQLDEKMRMVAIGNESVSFNLKSPKSHFYTRRIHVFKRAETDGMVTLTEKEDLRSEVENFSRNQLNVGKLFSVRYMRWTHYHRNPLGYVEGLYSNDRQTQINVKYHVPREHRREINKEARRLVQAFVSSKPKRRDLTKLFVFTIDDKRAKIYDDGLSIEQCKEHKDCWKVGVHIADVASVIPQDSLVDKEAKTRCCTFSTGSPSEGKMLPQAINDSCSLTAGNYVYTVSTFFHSSKPPKDLYSVLKDDTASQDKDESCSPDFDIVLTKVQPKMNLSFENAQKYLDEENREKFSKSCVDNMTQQIYQLWKIFWGFRVMRLESAAFYQQFQESDYSNSEWYYNCMARILVEEAMITSNLLAVKFMKLHECEFYARAQSAPSDMKLLRWPHSTLSIYQTSCYKYFCKCVSVLNGEEKAPPKDKILISSKVWDDISMALRKGKLEAAVFLACCDNKQPEFMHGLKKLHSILPKGVCLHSATYKAHCHLRLEAYARCSSPMRRYEDFQNQKILVRILNGLSRKPLTLRKSIGKNLAEHINEKETNHKKHDKEVDLFKLCQQFQPHYVEGFVTQVVSDRFEVSFPILGEPCMVYNSKLLPTKTENTKVETKFSWLIRYYDLDETDLIPPPDFVEARTIDTRAWMNFLMVLNENKLMQQNRNNIEKALSSAINSIGKLPQRIELSEKLRTTNGIIHGKKIQLNISRSSTLHFQLFKTVRNGIWKLTPQLLHVQDNFNLCLHHRSRYGVFDFPYDKGSTLFVDDELRTYYEHWFDLVHLDGVYASVSNGNSIYLKSKLTVVCVKGQLFGVFIVSIAYCEERFLVIREDDFVCVRAPKKQSDRNCSWVAHGIITGVNKNDYDATITFMVSKIDEMGSPPKRGMVALLEIISLSISHRRMINALRSLPNTKPLIKDICLGNIDSVMQSKIILESGVNDVINSILKSVDGLETSLNAEQVEQIKKALCQEVTLIQGPPGTGKSLMGAYLAYYYVQARLNLLKDETRKRAKVLYCGPSNKSVDVVAGYLKNFTDLRIVRVYGSLLEEKDFPIPNKPRLHSQSEVPPDPKLRSFALHHIIREDGKPSASKLKRFDERFATEPGKVSFEEFNQYTSLLKDAKLDVLSNTDVVLCTCITAGGSPVNNVQYTHCIVDECGMCSEPECLVPLTTAAAQSESLQIALIGDHKQLEPIITCEQAARTGLKTSLFERLNKYAGKLTRQYRMDEKICSFPSKEFYNDELKTDISVKQRVNRHEPIVFRHVEGEEAEDDVKSKFNIGEVDAVVKEVQELAADSAEDVMILTPYIAQCEKLRERLQVAYKNLRIGTVISSQGSEANHVILSTVRSNSALPREKNPERPWLYKNLGFVSDDHQVNVAITRAKLSLKVVGNKHLLSKHKTWRNLVAHYTEAGSVT